MDDPIDRNAVLAGDFAHALRSSLDNLVYSLVVLNTRQVPDSTKIAWPVLVKPNADFFKIQTSGVPDEAGEIIELFQPYHAGQRDAFKGTYLWQLHKLDIIDKHRRIPLDTHGFHVHFGPGITKTDIVPHELNNGYELHLPLRAADIKMHLDPPS